MEKTMLNIAHEPPPIDGNRHSAGRTSTPRSWIESAARRLVNRGRRAAPTSPAPRNRDREAEAVRAMAYTYRVTDRRFADELYAAAERHERAADTGRGLEARPATADPRDCDTDIAD